MGRFGRLRNFGCDGELLYQTCLHDRSVDVSRANQALTGAAGTGVSPARMLVLSRAVAAG